MLKNVKLSMADTTYKGILLEYSNSMRTFGRHLDLSIADRDSKRLELELCHVLIVI